MSDNAYVQRMYPKEDLDLEDARFDEEKLRVYIPGLKGSKASSIRAVENSEFVVYTRKEAQELLDEMEMEYEKDIVDHPEEDGDEQQQGDDGTAACSDKDLPLIHGKSLLMFSFALHIIA